MAMALPASNSQCWRRLAAGELKHIKTENIGIPMMAKRLERSTAPIEEKAAEIFTFFQRWERGLTNEIAQL